MVNGFNIHVSESDFKNADDRERDWMIFKAVEEIDQKGCSFGRISHRKESWSKLVAIAGAFGGALGTAVGFWAFMCR